MDRQQLILELGRDPALAHAVLFGNRHTDETPAFHLAMLRAWYSAAPYVLTMAFRGAAKSTRAEEAIVISACLKIFGINIVILGENEPRAVDRLRSIKHEFETNEYIEALFQIGPGATWGETRIVLSNGVCVQAYGRGQSLRGIKYLDARPGLIFCDDLETNESVLTPESRKKTKDWFTSTVLGALDVAGKVRMAATPLEPDALAPTLARNTRWDTKVYPIEYVTPAGERKAMWGARYSLEWIDAKRDEFTSLGQHDKYMQEFMCQAVDPSTRVFLAEQFRTVQREPSWHAVYAVYDPARTVKSTSATTGKVVFSWIRNKLVVWEADAQRWLPDKIIEDVFSVNDRYRPVLVGIEEDGLNEFIMQPLRQEQLRRASLLPLRPLKAPRGKLDFIRGLQPFFKGGQVEFASDSPGMQLLRQQLLSFPTGDIDAPNALAYALNLQPLNPVYDAFDGDLHIDVQLMPLPGVATWLAVNATPVLTSAVLVQVKDGVVRVLLDWLRESDPGLAVTDIVKEARLELASPGYRLPAKGTLYASHSASLRLLAPLEHWAEYDVIGLRAAAARVPAELHRGGSLMQGREELREAMAHSVHGVPAFTVSPHAAWTLRALTGGYAWRHRDNKLELVDGPYAVLMAGLEAFSGMLRNQEDDSDPHFSYTADGRKYVSALSTAR